MSNRIGTDDRRRVHSTRKREGVTFKYIHIHRLFFLIIFYPITQPNTPSAAVGHIPSRNRWMGTCWVTGMYRLHGSVVCVSAIGDELGYTLKQTVSSKTAIQQKVTDGSLLLGNFVGSNSPLKVARIRLQDQKSDQPASILGPYLCPKHAISS